MGQIKSSAITFSMWPLTDGRVRRNGDDAVGAGAASRTFSTHLRAGGDAIPDMGPRLAEAGRSRMPSRPGMQSGPIDSLRRRGAARCSMQLFR
jgi:hypothetical protein